MVAIASFPPLLGFVPREHLASGGQSAVYRALNPSTDQLAAIKVVPLRVPPGAAAAAAGGTAAMDPATAAKAKQLVREMRIHETLHHRNILRLFGGETRDECTVRATAGGETTWPSGLYMVLDLGAPSLSPTLPSPRPPSQEAVHASLELSSTDAPLPLQPTAATSSTRSVSRSHARPQARRTS